MRRREEKKGMCDERMSFLLFVWVLGFGDRHDHRGKVAMVPERFQSS
jgi:hypothetical protein